MKLILTESQIKKVMLMEQMLFILNEAICEDKTLYNVKKIIKQMIIAGMSLSAITYAINNADLKQKDKDILIGIAQEEVIAKEDDVNTFNTSINNVNNNQLFLEKINAIENYMEKALHNQNYTKDDTDLTAEALVKASYENNFDLPLLMAAAHLESCFGATPRARRTNSVYSVGAYDNGRDVVTYNHPNESIQGYIELLINDYLIDGKTINDLLIPGKFINKNGHRYASNKNYEKELKFIRDKIKKNYPILA